MNAPGKRLILLLILPFGNGSFAQAPPVELQVMPVVQQPNGPRTSYSVNPNSDATIASAQRTLTSYTIQLSRALTPLNGVLVRWAILVQAPASGQLRLVQGERTCDVPVRDAVTIRTQPITTSVVIRSTTNYAEYPYNSSSTVGAEPVNQIKGYEVEVFVNGRRVIVKAEPPAVQQQIEAVRAAQQQAPPIPPPPPPPPAP